MESTNLKTLRELTEPQAASSHAYVNLSPRAINAVRAVAVGAVLMTPQLAMAQDSGGLAFFCYIATYFKQIVGGAALVALLMWAIEHIFGVAKLHDVVIKVGIAAAIVIGATTIITKSGLVAPTNCTTVTQI